jgi:hypothetical protein
MEKRQKHKRAKSLRPSRQRKKWEIGPAEAGNLSAVKAWLESGAQIQ